MPKIKEKVRYYYDNQKESPTYEVYSVRSRSEKYRGYDDEEWTENKNQFFIYSHGSWGWVDADEYEPVD